MVIRLILVIVALCVGVFVLFFFYAKDAVGEKTRFAVFNPAMNDAQTVEVQQHNNKIHTVKIFGVDGPGAIGNMMMSNIKEVGLGRGCCPFSFPEKAIVSAMVTELYSQNELVEQSDRMVSVAFSPMFILFAQ
jgi:hypothetical protein